MFKQHILIVAAILLFSIIGILVFATTGEKKPVVAKVKGDAKPSRPFIASQHYVPPEKLPLGWEDFLTQNEAEQLERVTAEMENRRIDPDVLTLFKAEIFNRMHLDTTRNNMANALVWQEKPDPNLHTLFIMMLEDETEDVVWRDYCLQFLSECMPSTREPELVQATLQRYSKGKDSLAGTAIIHLAYQEQEGRLQIDESISTQLESQLIDPNVSLATRASILGVIGQRRDKRFLPLVRAYAKDKDDGLRRCAIATLGQIGTSEDVPLIEAAILDHNRAVQLAAKAALQRIQEANKPDYDVKTPNRKF